MVHCCHCCLNVVVLPSAPRIVDVRLLLLVLLLSCQSSTCRATESGNIFWTCLCLFFLPLRSWDPHGIKQLSIAHFPARSYPQPLLTSTVRSGLQHKSHQLELADEQEDKLGYSSLHHKIPPFLKNFLQREHLRETPVGLFDKKSRQLNLFLVLLESKFSFFRFSVQTSFFLLWVLMNQNIVTEFCFHFGTVLQTFADNERSKGQWVRATRKAATCWYKWLCLPKLLCESS